MRTQERGIPLISVIIATRNRPLMLQRAVSSVLASTSGGFEVVVIDQSDVDTPLKTGDSRVSRIYTDQIGQARAWNLGVRKTAAPFVALTDDDCDVDAGWLAALIEAFGDSRIELIYGRVNPPADPPGGGYVPQFDGGNGHAPRRLGLTDLWGSMGANMALRRDLIREIGEFDEAFGPGGILESGADLEYGVRAVELGRGVYGHPGAVVTHSGGWRSDTDAPLLWRRNGIALGGLLAKGAREIHYQMTAFPLLVLGSELAGMPRRIARREPSGLRRVGGNMRGLIDGWRRGCALGLTGPDVRRVFQVGSHVR